MGWYEPLFWGLVWQERRRVQPGGVRLRGGRARTPASEQPGRGVAPTEPLLLSMVPTPVTHSRGKHCRFPEPLAGLHASPVEPCGQNGHRSAVVKRLCGRWGTVCPPHCLPPLPTSVASAFQELERHVPSGPLRGLGPGSRWAPRGSCWAATSCSCLLHSPSYPATWCHLPWTGSLQGQKLRPPHLTSPGCGHCSWSS